MSGTQVIKKSYAIFTINLMEWHRTFNKRTMPWKGEKDAYKIWISEIILQQTRVKQGVAYYNRFLENFPNLYSLATAEDGSVFKVWEGLGYYTRCRNVLHTSRYIQRELNGKFPDNYDDILKLKGIGPYTAAAIASFAYGLPHAVVDGNVFRVLSRFFGETIPIDSTEGIKFFTTLADKVLYKQDPASYNQAIMDFGATVCKPQIAECSKCMLQPNCVAYKRGWVNKLPVKEKKLKRSNRWFYYFVFSINDEVLVSKRTGKDIWQSLYEFYLYEADNPIQWNDASIALWLTEQLGIKHYKLKHISANFSQQLTHQNLKGQFILIQLPTLHKSLKHFKRVKSVDLSSYAFPKFIHQYLVKNPLNTSVKQ